MPGRGEGTFHIPFIRAQRKSSSATQRQGQEEVYCKCREQEGNPSTEPGAELPSFYFSVPSDISDLICPLSRSFRPPDANF